MGVDAGLIDKLGSDEGCEVLIGGEWATFCTSRVVW